MFSNKRLYLLLMFGAIFLGGAFCWTLAFVAILRHHAHKAAASNAQQAVNVAPAKNALADLPFIPDSPANLVQSTQITPQPKGIDKPLPCPLGLAWGENMEAVKKALSDKGYTSDVQSGPGNPIDGEVIVTGKGTSIDGEKFDHVYLYAAGKDLQCFNIKYTRPSSDQDTLAQFHRIAKNLAAAYGRPTLALFSIAPAFSGSPKMEMLDISRGNDSVYDSWDFSPSNLKANGGTVSVYLGANPTDIEPTSSPSVSVSYFNQTLLRPG